MKAKIRFTEKEMAMAFDPSEHNVKEVQQYLREQRDAGNDDEVKRVLAAEYSGEQRSSILGVVDDEPEPDVVEAQETTARGEQATATARRTWDVRTHGNPPFGREGEYEVIGR